MMDISKGDRNGNGYPGARPLSLSLSLSLSRLIFRGCTPFCSVTKGIGLPLTANRAFRLNSSAVSFPRLPAGAH